MGSRPLHRAFAASRARESDAPLPDATGRATQSKQDAPADDALDDLKELFFHSRLNPQLDWTGLCLEKQHDFKFWANVTHSLGLLIMKSVFNADMPFEDAREIRRMNPRGKEGGDEADELKSRVAFVLLSGMLSNRVPGSLRLRADERRVAVRRGGALLQHKRTKDAAAVPAGAAGTEAVDRVLPLLDVAVLAVHVARGGSAPEAAGEHGEVAAVRHVSRAGVGDVLRGEGADAAEATVRLLPQVAVGPGLRGDLVAARAEGGVPSGDLRGGPAAHERPGRVHGHAGERVPAAAVAVRGGGAGGGGAVPGGVRGADAGRAQRVFPPLRSDCGGDAEDAGGCAARRGRGPGRGDGGPAVRPQFAGDGEDDLAAAPAGARGRAGEVRLRGDAGVSAGAAVLQRGVRPRVPRGHAAAARGRRGPRVCLLQALRRPELLQRVLRQCALGGRPPGGVRVFPGASDVRAVRGSGRAGGQRDAAELRGGVDNGSVTGR
ncbi:MYND Zn finger containing protein, putative [Babesia caballi]|uniref:MYND Zn finger containing protein, putative n=1 Tax=Babesia caballi TaxID=5871 RepID=A0AAV4LPZ9_BABCB|nr:MYND Zn finger containing protein, putative [Babesia caballi]